MRLEDDGQRARSYGDAVSRVRGLLQQKLQGLAKEQANAEELLAELDRHPLERRQWMVRNSARFHLWKLCDLLLHRCERRWLDEPQAAHEDAYLAVEAAEFLSRETYSAGMVQDLKALAWAHLANTYRLLERQTDAHQAMFRAQLRLRRGTGDTLVTARILTFKAMVCFERAKVDKGIQLMERVIALYQRLGEERMAVRGMMCKAEMLRISGDANAAFWLLQQAGRRFDPLAEPRLQLAWLQLLAAVLVDTGDPRKARSYLDRLKSLQAEVPDRLLAIRRQWLEGRVSAAEGDLERAEELLRDARRSLEELGKRIEGGRVALDLADIYRQQRRPRDLRFLLKELATVVEGRLCSHEGGRLSALFDEAGLA